MEQPVWHILLVDDDREDYIITQSLLDQSRNHKTVLDFAQTYLDGQNLLQSNTYDVILVDYDLGEKTGIDFIREAVSAGYPAPLILFTGRGSYEVDVEAMRAGASLYLTKGEMSPLLLEHAIRYAIEQKQSEQALRTSEAEFRAIFELASVGNAEIDPATGRFLRVNRKLCELSGYSEAELLEMTYQDLAHPDDREQDRAHYRRLIAADLDEWESEKRMVRKDGAEIWLQTSARLLRDASGRPVRVFVVLQDITSARRLREENERHRAALSEALDLNRKIISASQVGILAYTSAGQCVLANEAAGRIVRATPEQLLAQNFYELASWKTSGLTDLARAALSSGQPQNRELHFVTTFGREVWLKWYFNVFVSAGERHLLAIFEDITERKQAEEALRRFELLSAHSRDIILYIRRGDGRLLEANTAAVIAYGYSREELLSLTVHDLRAPDTEDLTGSQMEEAFAGGILFETLHRRKDGSVFPVEVSSQGAVIGGEQTLVSVIRDISERKGVEAEIQNLARFPGENPSPVIRLSSAGKILYANLVSQELLQSWECSLGEIAPEPILRLVRASLESGSLQHWEARLPRKTWFLTFTPIPDTQYVNVYGADISELRRTEETLRASEARERARASELAAIMDAVPAIVWVTHDPLSREVDGNWAAFQFLRAAPGSNLSKSAPEAEAPRNFRVFKDGRELLPEELPLQLAAATGKPIRDFEEEVVFDDGSRAHLLGNVTPLLDESGQPAGAVAAFIDITGLKKAEERLKAYAEELERSNRDLQEFALIASHDLQEPLRKIEAFVGQLKDSSLSLLSGQQLEFLHRIEGAASRMRRMINDLLELSRVSTRGQPFAPVDLNAVARSVVEDLEVRLRQAGGRVELGSLPVIQADEFQMHQLLLNLVGNALKFQSAGSPPLIKVDCRENTPEQVTIAVEDNGIGFDVQHLEHILQPFKRLHGRSEYEGSGIGLAICAKIVERHSGSIRAQSAPGQGSVFLVTLPKRQSSELPVQAS